MRHGLRIETSNITAEFVSDRPNYFAYTLIETRNAVNERKTFCKVSHYIKF